MLGEGKPRSKTARDGIPARARNLVSARDLRGIIERDAHHSPRAPRAPRAASNSPERDDAVGTFPTASLGLRTIARAAANHSVVGFSPVECIFFIELSDHIGDSPPVRVCTCFIALSASFWLPSACAAM